MVSLLLLTHLNAYGKIKDPEELFKKVVSTYQALKSYEFVNYKKGYDTFSKERETETKGTYGEVGKKIGKKVEMNEVSQKPQIKEGVYEVRFKKPFLLQMKIIKSDFCPSVVYGTVITYRPDKDPNVWWAKLKYMPVAMKRSVKKDDSGGFFSMGWAFSIINMHNQKKNGIMKIKGMEKVQGRDCYLLEFTFDPKRVKPYQPNLKEWGVPAALESELNNTIRGLKKQKTSSVKYWIDAQRFLILKSEEYVRGKFHWQDEYRDIKLNHLSAEDF